MVLKQEDLPLDPDEIDEVVQEPVEQTGPSSQSSCHGEASASSVSLNKGELSLSDEVEQVRVSNPVEKEGTHRDSCEVIDLTMMGEGEASEPDGAGYSEDEFDSLMEDIDDDEFCSSFANFDDDWEEDKRQTTSVEIERGEEEESEGEGWSKEEVDHVKTIAEMAEEANAVDLFDPNVLGKALKISCMKTWFVLFDLCFLLWSSYMHEQNQCV